MHFRFTIRDLLWLTFGSFLVCGCSRPAPIHPKTQPTAFFDWCVSEKFGVKSVNQALAQNSSKNVSSGEIGTAKYSGWINSKTEEEAQEALSGTIAELRRVAEEKGITMQPADDVPDPHKWRYTSDYIRGTLAGGYELIDVPDARSSGKLEKAYFVTFKLTELVQLP